MLQPKRKATMNPVPKKLPGKNPATRMKLARAVAGPAMSDPCTPTRKRKATKKIGRRK